MIESGGGARFALKSLERAWIGGKIVGEHFQRDKPSEPGVLRPLDDTHAAGAESFNDSVVGDGSSDQGRVETIVRLLGAHQHLRVPASVEFQAVSLDSIRHDII